MTALAPRRTITVALALVLASVALAVPARAHHGTTGSVSVTAVDRTALELVAEASMLDLHNDQRVAGQTRNGVRYTDVGTAGRMQGWTDINTVARRWADKLSFSYFKHNPDYSRQYGHWSAVGENIAIVTIGRQSRGTPTSSQVRAAAEQMMQNWWESDGHRHNWMNSRWDQFGVGAAVTVQDVGASEPYWVLVGVTNFRDWDRTAITGATGFTADGRTPPNESAHAATSTTSTVRFKDVPRTHTFYANVEALAASGVTKGCGSSTFCPDDYVTRGQMAAFLTRALDLPRGTLGFTDTRGHLFEAPISALARAGVTKGCGVARFCPDDYVTRGQMAAFLTRALDLPSSSLVFDDTRGHLFQKPIAALAKAGVTKGCGGGDFCPNDYVTRGQMAAFLDRAGVLD